jgi:hypothetical protein
VDRTILFWVIEKEMGLHGQYSAGSGLKNCQDIVNRLMVLKITHNAGDFLTSRGRVNFSKTTLSCRGTFSNSNMANGQTCEGVRQTIYIYINIYIYIYIYNLPLGP